MMRDTATECKVSLADGSLADGSPAERSLAEGLLNSEQDPLRAEFLLIDHAVAHVHVDNLDSARDLLLRRAQILQQLLAKAKPTQDGLHQISHLAVETEEMALHFMNLRQGLVLEANNFAAQRNYAECLDPSLEESHWKTSL
jgi:hypothetical protein